jgi:DNA-binding MarR family transcriptional regulator
MPVKQTWEQQLGDDRAHAYRLFFVLGRDLFEVLAKELLDECQLEITWYDVLLQLDESPEARMRMTDLAAAVVITRGGLTKLVDRMEAAGLVRRMPSAADRRVVEIELTKAGSDRFEAAARVHRRGIVEHFVNHITEDEARVMLAALERVRANLDEAPQPA